MTSKRLTCKETVELVTEYLETTLLPEMETRFSQHLDTCPGCTVYIDQMRRTLHTLHQLTNETLSEEEKATLLQLFQNWQASTPIAGSPTKKPLAGQLSEILE